MKNIFTLLLATIFSVAAFARNEGKITITIANKKNIQVYIDGRLYQESDNAIVLNNVQPGNHTIRIYKTRKNSDRGNSRRNERNDNNLIYSSTVYVKPSYHVDVVINRFGKALVDERSLNDRNNNWDEGWNDDSYDDGGYNNNYRQAMNDTEFNQLVQRIRNQWLGRLGNAKDAINNNYFTTYQMKQLLQLFSSENDKLELAKLSFKNIVDRQNFKQLYDLFSYQGQSELDRYVRDYRY